jgi:hypothetical protein
MMLKMAIFRPGEDEPEVCDVECREDEHRRPVFEDLIPEINAALKMAPGVHYEHVKVFWKDEHLDAFVDEFSSLADPNGVVEVGRSEPLPVNEKATEIYHNNVRVHEPRLLKGAASIHGTMVLFDRPVWF